MKYCLGTVQFGINYGIQGNTQPRYEDVYDILNYAIDHGILQFDTAAAYGEAENVLGSYIRSMPDKAMDMNIVSKLSPDSFSSSDKTEWKQIAVTKARESLLRLGIERFSAFLFHNATLIYDENAVAALTAVKEAGLTDCIGVSVYTPEEAMKALSYSQLGAIQIPYNLFDKRLDKCGFFEKAKDRNIIIYARSSLLQGLAVMDPYNLPDRVSFAKEYLLKYDAICKEYAVSKLNAAIGYVAQKDDIDYIVFGVDNMTQLKEYLSLENKYLPASMIASIDEIFDNTPEKLVNPTMWK